MKDLEFYISEIKTGKNGEHAVIGAPDNRLDLHVGDVFIIRYDIDHKDFELPSDECDHYAFSPVRLTVDKIFNLGRFVDELSAGHWGKVFLKGEGFELLTPKSYLRTVNKWQ